MKSEADIRKLRNALAKILDSKQCECSSCLGNRAICGFIDGWILGESIDRCGVDDPDRWEETIFAEAAKL